MHSRVQALLGQNETYKTKLYKMEREKKEKDKLNREFQSPDGFRLLTYDQLKAKSDQDSEELLKQGKKISSLFEGLDTLRAENAQLKTTNDTLTMENNKMKKNIEMVEDAMLAVRVAVSS